MTQEELDRLRYIIDLIDLERDMIEGDIDPYPTDYEYEYNNVKP